MPQRSKPTARQVRLGAELRKLREAAGMTAREAASLLGTDQTKISHLEAGRAGVSAERIRRLANLYACLDEALVEALVVMANERGRGWWEEYGDVLGRPSLDLAELEHHATSLRALEVVHVPGLLQTEQYMRAMLAYGIPEPPRRELEARVSHRMRRREVLDRESPPAFEVVVHEAALRMRVGGRRVARAQLEHILGMSERPGITLRLIPFTAEGFAGLGYSMLHLGGPVPQLDTVQLDSLHGITFVDADAQLRRYRALFEKAAASSLGPDESRSRIHRLAKEL